MFWAATNCRPEWTGVFMFTYTFQVSVGTLLAPPLALHGIGQALEFHSSAVRAMNFPFLTLGSKLFPSGDCG